ncbi:hypothetical protein ABZ929_27080 [Streptomyces physcomitrii]|uniref:hypothetical protein n=1 Tax=Streptomyces physcomitrii TaxID=2724184 RepID=UPI00342FA0B2
MSAVTGAGGGGTGPAGDEEPDSAADAPARADASARADIPSRADAPEPEAQARTRRAHQKHNERYAWWALAYFLFGLHIVAFVMIYAVRHAK